MTARNSPWRGTTIWRNASVTDVAACLTVALFLAGLCDALSQGGVRQNAPHALAARTGNGTDARELLPTLLTVSAVASLYKPQDGASAVVSVL